MVYEILFKDDFSNTRLGIFESVGLKYIKDNYEILEIKEVLLGLVG